MQLGALLPLGDIGGDPATVREYAQTAEAIGYEFVEAPDHVLGASEASASERVAPGPGYTTTRLCCSAISPAARTSSGFSTGVLILPQRQTVLVAKQAASLDVLCGGRFRLGIGVGWNEVEFTGLNENFHNRGRRSEEQVQVMQALWAEPHVDLQGQMAHDRGRRHQPACRSAQGAGVVRRASRAHVAAHRQMGRRLDAERLSARPERPRHFRPIAPADRRGGPRSRQVGIEVWVSMGTGNGSRLGEGNPVLETGRRLASLPDDDLQPPPPQAHPRPHDGRPPGGAATIPHRHRRSAVGRAVTPPPGRSKRLPATFRARACRGRAGSPARRARPCPFCGS